MRWFDFSLAVMNLKHQRLLQGYAMHIAHSALHVSSISTLLQAFVVVMLVSFACDGCRAYTPGGCGWRAVGSLVWPLEWAVAGMPCVPGNPAAACQVHAHPGVAGGSEVSFACHSHDGQWHMCGWALSCISRLVAASPSACGVLAHTVVDECQGSAAGHCAADGKLAGKRVGWVQTSCLNAYVVPVG